MKHDDINPRFAEAAYQHDLKVRPWEQPRADHVQPAEVPAPTRSLADLPPLQIDVAEPDPEPADDDLRAYDNSTRLAALIVVMLFLTLITLIRLY